jgi:hypothetical protein
MNQTNDAGHLLQIIDPLLLALGHHLPPTCNHPPPSGVITSMTGR